MGVCWKAHATNHTCYTHKLVHSPNERRGLMGKELAKACYWINIHVICRQTVWTLYLRYPFTRKHTTDTKGWPSLQQQPLTGSTPFCTVMLSATSPKSLLFRASSNPTQLTATLVFPLLQCMTASKQASSSWLGLLLRAIWTLAGGTPRYLHTTGHLSPAFWQTWALMSISVGFDWRKSAVSIRRSEGDKCSGCSHGSFKCIICKGEWWSVPSNNHRALHLEVNDGK